MTKEEVFKEKFIGGISLTEKTPKFSKDGQYIVQCWKNQVCSYFCKTGRMIQYAGQHHDIIAFDIYRENNMENIIACSVSGNIISWNLKNGFILKQNNINQPNIVQFQCFHESHETDQTTKAVVCWKTDTKLVYALFMLDSFKIIRMLGEVDKSNASVIAFGGFAYDPFIAFFGSKNLYTKYLRDYDKLSRKKMAGRFFTCITCHPQSEQILTGDNTGRVLLWHSIKKNAYTVFHWHTMPVKAVCFSKTGTFFYSGGFECVLVKWNIKNPNDKSFLPRLPASITQISVAANNQCLAVCTEDNAIHIMDMQFNIINIIQEFSVFNIDNPEISSSAAMNSIIINGSTGRLLFYNPIRRQLMFNLDVVGMNKITPERDSQITNVDVRKFVVDRNSNWLATLEEYNGVHIQETRLKFWKYNNKGSFQLCTSIDSPHTDHVVDMQFQPSTSSNNTYFVTIGSDKLFKLWKSHSFESNISWKCDASAYYKRMTPTRVAFSSDGSILAIAFEYVLTIWDPTTCTSKYTLKHPLHTEHIRNICFGNNEQCHLVVVTTENYMSVWNLLSLSLVYVASLKTKFLLTDNISNYMTILSTKNQLIVFELPSMQPLIVKNLSTEKLIVAASLMKHHGASDKFYDSNTFYYITSDKQLYGLELASNDNEDNNYSNPVIDDNDEERSIFTLLQSKNSTKGTANKVGTVSLYKSTKKKTFNVFDHIIHSMVPVRNLTYVTLLPFLETVKEPTKTEKTHMEELPAAMEELKIQEKPLEFYCNEGIEWVSLLKDS